jgi:hypothetical protein
MNWSLLKQPPAFTPIVMSVAALSLVVSHLLLVGTAREPDEGTAAHIWQLLMAGQAPFVLHFAAKWLPQAPGPALRVLALHVLAGLAACAPVAYFNL